MKKALLLITSLIFLTNSFAQTYHENDKNALRELVRNELKSSQYNAIGITHSDTIGWLSSELWISKVTGVSWNNMTPSRVTKIDWAKNIGMLDQSGKFDFSGFPELTYLATDTEYDIEDIEIDISKNAKLTHFQGRGFNFGDYQFENNPALEVLKLYNCQVKATDNKLSFPHQPKLKELYISFKYKPIVDMSHNPLLKVFRVSEVRSAQPVKFDLSKNKLLEDVGLTVSNAPTIFSFADSIKLKSLYFLHGSDDVLNVDLSNITSVERFSSSGIGFSNLMIEGLRIDTLIITGTKLPKPIDFNKIKGLKYLSIIQMFKDGSLKNLDLSKCTELRMLSCPANKLESLDISNSPNLEIVYAAANKLSALDVSHCPNLKILDTSLNNLKELLLHPKAKLEELECDNNQLMFSKLPLNNVTKYTYAPQNANESRVEYSMSDIVDLSGEYTIDGRTTKFEWYNSNSGKEITLPGSNGKFQLNEELVNTLLDCKMTNPRFPNLTVTYSIYVTDGTGFKYNKLEKEALKEIIRKEFATNNGDQYEIPYVWRLGIQATDTLDWNYFESWVDKVKRLQWSETTPKRLLKINWGEYHLTIKQKGIIDLSAFTELQSLDINAGYGGKLFVDITKNGKLTHLKATGIDLKDYMFENNSNIDSLSLDQSRLKSYTETKFCLPYLPKLKYLSLRSTRTDNQIDMSYNPLLQSFSIYEGGRPSVDLSVCNQLKDIFVSYMSDVSFEFPTNAELDNLHLHMVTQTSKMDLSKLKSIKYIKLYSVSIDSIGSFGTEKMQVDTLNMSSIRGNTKKINYNNFLGLRKLILSSLAIPEVLDLSECDKLSYLHCPDFGIRSILTHPDAEFDYIDISNNHFPSLSSLPQNKVNEMKCEQIAVSRHTVNLGDSDVLDLSSEYNLGGSITNYEWDYTETLTGPADLGNGKFRFDDSHSGKSLSFTLTNDKFPGFTYGCLISVEAGNSLEGNALDNKSVYPEKTIVNRDEQIILINNTQQNGIAEIYDVTGKLMIKKWLTRERNEFEAPSIAGIYIVHARMENGVNTSFKIIVK